MKRGLVLSKYGTLAASTRQRFSQAAPYLSEVGIDIDIHPLFDDAYLKQLFAHNTRASLAILRAYWARFLELFRARNYDFLWLNYELFPYLPSFFEALIRVVNIPVIYDIDDAIFHQYEMHSNKLVRFLLKEKLAPLLQKCDLAFCGNAYLELYVKRYCPHTEIIPTVVDCDIYVPKLRTETKSVTTPVLGWIGSPSTWKYCATLTDIFASYVQANEISTLVIGAGHAANMDLPFTFREWSEESEVEDIQEMDIGIMPLPDAPWARGKCGYKLIQYMACGLPVIASPVGVNCDIVEHGVNGFLARNEVEWRSALERLISDPDLRKRMGQAGRAHIQQHYSIQTYGPRIAELIQSLLANQL